MIGGVFYRSPKMGKHGRAAESGHFWLLKSMVQYQWVHHTTQCMRCQLSFLTLTPNIMNISVYLVTHGPIRGVWWNSHHQKHLRFRPARGHISAASYLHKNRSNVERLDITWNVINWLLVSTHLKNISQLGHIPQVENKKYLSCHHLVNLILLMLGYHEPTSMTTATTTPWTKLHASLHPLDSCNNPPALGQEKPSVGRTGSKICCIRFTIIWSI